MSRSEQRLPLFGQLMRIVSVTLFATLLGFVCYYVYDDIFGKEVVADQGVDIVEIASAEDTVILDSTEINSVAAPVESPDSDQDSVELDSITSCISQEIIDEAEHPLDPLLEMARRALEVVRENVRDYEATIVKRVRWNGKLQGEQFIRCKIRHGDCDDAETTPEKKMPLSVYTRFLRPKAGQEAIWIDGCNDGKIIAHGPPGLLNVLTLSLDPNCSMAMRGNRYSIECIGMLNLLEKMIEKGENDRKHGSCIVKITRNVRVGSSNCTRFEIIHSEPVENVDYHKAEIYIDDERNLPIAYRGYDFPDSPGGRPKLIERYFYKDILVNVGLTDADFDPANEAYDFPGY